VVKAGDLIPSFQRYKFQKSTFQLPADNFFLIRQIQEDFLPDASIHWNKYE
jgi:hypothetical protein